MSTNIANKDSNNTEQSNKKWIKYIEDAITNGDIIKFDYQNFENIRVLGVGGFGKVYSATYKKLNKSVALKSVNIYNDNSMRNFVNEVLKYKLLYIKFVNYNFTVYFIFFLQMKIQRNVDFHDNILRFYGLTQKGI
jgi:serine/threonine protein kinase